MRKIYIVLSLLLITGITFGQDARIENAPVKKDVVLNSSQTQTRGVRADMNCSAGSLFGNDYMDVSLASKADAGYVRGTDFETIGGTIETLKFWGVTVHHDGTAFSSCNENNPLTVDVNFYEDYTALEAGIPTNSFNDLIATAITTAELLSDYPVYEWDVTLPSSVSLASGIVTINADTVGTANVTDCELFWISSTSGYGNSYVKSETLLGTDVANQFTICMGGTPASCLIPTNLSSSNITNVSADVSWTENGSASLWEYEIVASGDTPTGTGINVFSPSASIPGLAPSTVYDVYVRSDCGGSYSDWSAPYTFITIACDQVDQCNYEFIVNDTYGDGWNGAYISVVQDGFEIYQIANTITGPEDVLTTETLFNAICTGRSIELVWNSGSFDSEVSFTINSPFGAEIINITDGSALTNGAVIQTFTSDCFPTCMDPVDLYAYGTSMTTADLTWTEAGTATSWNIEYGVTGFTPSETGLNVTSNSYSLSGLNSGTSYDFYVQADCGSYNSEWVGPFTFLTQCNAITAFPYLEDFESMDNNFVCWQTYRNTAADGGLDGTNLSHTPGWKVIDPTSFTGNGANYIYSGVRSAGIHWAEEDFSWLVSRDIVLPASGSYDLSFWTWFNNNITTETWISKFYVQIYADGVWNTELSWTDGTYDNLFAEEIELNLAAYANKTIKIAFIYEFDDGIQMSIDDIKIEEHVNPTPVISGVLEFCTGGSTTLDAGAGYSNYAWSPAGSSQQLTVATPGVYEVTVTDVYGFTGTTSVTVTENSNPTPTITGDLQFCTGGITTLDAGSGYNAYAWTPSGSTQVFNASSDGTYSVTVTDMNGCIGSTSVAVSENAIPSPSPSITGTLEFCEGNSTTLNAGPGYSSYSWSSTGSSQTLGVTSGGTYSVTVSNVDGCLGSTSVVITENANPIPSIAGASYFCTGSTTTIDAGAGYSDYSWTPFGSSQSIDANMVGIYSVTVTDVNGCEGSENITITESVNPTPTITGALGFCSGNSTTLDAGVGFFNYSWSPAGSAQTLDVNTAGMYIVSVTDGNGCVGTGNVTVVENANPTPDIAGTLYYCIGSSTILDAGAGYSDYTWWPSGADQTLDVTTTGNYTVTVTDVNGCEGSDIVAITESSTPTPAITGTMEFCAGSTTTISAEAGFETYEWSATGSSQDLLVTTGGDYTVTVTGINGCEATNTVTVTENILPAVSITGDIYICNGQSTTLDAGAGFVTYAWSPLGNEQTLDVDATGTFAVTVTDGNGCENSSSFDVTVVETPVISLVGGGTFCLGDVDSYVESDIQNNLKWYLNGVEISGEILSQCYPSESGDYTCENTLCSLISEVVTITVNEPTIPVITAAGDLEICEGETITLTSDQTTNIIWSNAEITQDVAVDETGDYTVVYTDVNGCEGASEIISVVVNQNPEVPTISQTGSMLAASSANTYQWYFGGEVIEDEATQFLTVAQTGFYTVEIFDEDGCSEMSEPLSVVISNVGVTTNTEISVYPNPTSGLVNITVSGNGVEATVEIVDIIGKTIAKEQLNSILTQIDLSELPKGIYLIKIKEGESSKVEKLILK